MYEEHIIALITAWNTGNTDPLDNFVAPDAIRRSPSTMSDMTANDLGELKQLITAFRTSFPDMKVTINETFESEDRAAIRWTFTGTNTGPGETPPTGKFVEIEGASVHHYENGKIKYEQVYFDTAGFFAQLGTTEASKGAAG